jgi:peptide chain release factor 1
VIDQLERLEATFAELTARLASPEVHSDLVALRETSRALAEIEPVVLLYRRFREIEARSAEARALEASTTEDAEMRQLASEELGELEPLRTQIENQLREALVPKDPNDDRNVVLEVRAGTGGDEASLFAADLFRMYTRYAERHGWRIEILDLSESDAGGVKELSAIIEGRGAWSRLKHEGGIHRVQRVPTTESSGRIHTSAATVAVLPEAEDVEVQISEKDLRIDRYCSSGPGGQGVNTTYSAVRLTHLPSGIVVTCQDERSQIKNRDKALRVLKSRLLERERQRAGAELAAERRRMVGSGDRSEKIRTYNFHQNRVTDHRIGLTLHQLTEVLEGALDPLLDRLVEHERASRLEEQARQATD